MTAPRRWNGRPRPVRKPAAAAVVRADVRLTNSGGFIRRFASWDEACTWLQSPDLVNGLAGISSIRLIHTAAQRDATPDKTAGGTS